MGRFKVVARVAIVSFYFYAAAAAAAAETVVTIIGIRITVTTVDDTRSRYRRYAKIAILATENS